MNNNSFFNYLEICINGYDPIEEKSINDYFPIELVGIGLFTIHFLKYKRIISMINA